MEEVIRWNERYKALGNLADNMGAAFFIAAGAEAYHVIGLDISALVGFALGLVFVAIGWHMRGYIQSER